MLAPLQVDLLKQFLRLPRTASHCSLNVIGLIIKKHIDATGRSGFAIVRLLVCALNAPVIRAWGLFFTPQFALKLSVNKNKKVGGS
jgi:hypothetical protein